MHESSASTQSPIPSPINDEDDSTDSINLEQEQNSISLEGNPNNILNHKSTEEKKLDDFLNRVTKEKVSNLIRDRNLEKKILQSNEDPTSEDITAETQSTIIAGNEPTFSSEIAEASATVLKFSYNQRVEQGLIRELSAFIGEKSLSNSISDKRITVNMPDRDDLSPGESEIRSFASSAPYLAHLFDKAKQTGQKEILRWYYYSEEFEKKVIDISSKNNINDQMAKTQIYDEMGPYLP
ncbi:13336_t:CDS:2, partial [Entrophospora sp. SA101]